MSSLKRKYGIKILLLDIETSPALAYIWGLFNQTISINQIVEPSKILCWSAKWLGESTVHYGSLRQRKPLQMLGKIHRMLDEADAVVHYNGKSFDIKHLNREFLEHGYEPPSPYKQIDLLQTTRQNFKFLSNKLQYLLQQLDLGEKEDSGGFKTWVGCLKNDPKAWETIKKYNIADVVELEKLYTKLLPWIKGHPNRALYDVEKDVCPSCGSDNLQRRGYYRGVAYMYQRYKCAQCGTWFRSARSDGGRQAKFVRAV